MKQLMVRTLPMEQCLREREREKAEDEQSEPMNALTEILQRPTDIDTAAQYHIQKI